MNEELKKIITYLIDNGSKGYEWQEDGMDRFIWTINNKDYTLYFNVDYYKPDSFSYSLSLFTKCDLICQLYFSDWHELDYQVRDELIDRIKKLELIP